MSFALLRGFTHLVMRCWSCNKCYSACVVISRKVDIIRETTRRGWGRHTRPHSTATVSFICMKENSTEKYNQLSDEEVYLLSVEEPEAFSFIFNRHVDGFVRRATYILGDKDEAKDAAQEAFIKLYGAASRYVPQREVPFKSFAYRILLNTCISIIRRRSARPVLELSDSAEEIIADDASTIQFEQYVARDWLASLVARLPIMLRNTVSRVIFAGKSTEEVAKEQGISEGAVRTRLSRATKEIQKLAVSLENIPLN